MKLKPYVRKANYYETDQMGIIHHSNYIRWFEEARVDFLEQLNYGYRRVTGAGLDFALVGLACDYKSMVRFGDTVQIYCGVSLLSPARMNVSYRVLDAVSGEVRAVGETRHCTFDSTKRRPVSLKKSLPELYALLQSCADEAL